MTPEDLAPEPEPMPEPSTPETPPPASAPPPPDGLTDTLVALQQTLGQMAEGMQLLAAGMRHQAPAAPAPPADVSDADLNAALQRGEDVAGLIAQRARALAAEAIAPVRAELDQLRGVGLSNLAALARSTLTGQKYYATYAKEIDAAVANLQDHLKGNPEALLFCYRQIVGLHAEEIAERAREEAVRAQRDVPAPTQGVTGRGSATQTPPQPDDLLPQRLREMAESGGGLRAVAQKMGYPHRGQDPRLSPEEAFVQEWKAVHPEVGS